MSNESANVMIGFDGDKDKRKLIKKVAWEYYGENQNENTHFIQYKFPNSFSAVSFLSILKKQGVIPEKE